MGGVIKTGNQAHDAACLAAEVTRQNALVGLGTGAAAQVTSDNAEITYWRAVAASCKTNNGGVGIEGPIGALKDLGTGGV
jgi:hypothetical protein